MSDARKVFLGVIVFVLVVPVLMALLIRWVAFVFRLVGTP